ncbi:MAG: radical SAM family heme chaperone HemW [Defluviitaleaceae bacterium]|nr:radical SAM family heme chaperone HemW [Defluviitaleaceae bacterium]
MTAGIYIHIPFCVKKCAYCDFFSFDNNKNFESYITGLLAELRGAAEREVIPTYFDTVYIGGGTPTALPSFLLCKILDAMRGLPLLPDAEITVEVNPGTLDAAYLAALRAYGVNRLSIGAQTTHSHLLHVLGRIHTREDFFETFRAARAAGFDNINADLMFALPKQTFSEWRETLAEIIALSPEHISAYSLTPAEGTPLWEQLERGEVVLPGDEADREMYHYARCALADAGYIHYEISNFAQPGRESRHNVNCWTMKPYFGFGAGAHSFDGARRWSNAENFDAYLNVGFSQGASPPAPRGQRPLDPEVLTPTILTEEKIILGLRMMRGVREDDFEVYAEQIEKLIRNGLLARGDGRVFLTPLGMDLANCVFEEFIV